MPKNQFPVLRNTSPHIPEEVSCYVIRIYCHVNIVFITTKGKNGNTCFLYNQRPFGLNLNRFGSFSLTSNSQLHSCLASYYSLGNKWCSFSNSLLYISIYAYIYIYILIDRQIDRQIDIDIDIYTYIYINIFSEYIYLYICLYLYRSKFQKSKSCWH